MPLVNKIFENQANEVVDRLDTSFTALYGAELVTAYIGPQLMFTNNSAVPVARYNRDHVSSQFGNDVWFVLGTGVHGTLAEIVLHFETLWHTSFHSVITN